MRKLSLEILTHGFVQHGQHHVEHYLQHVRNICTGGEPPAGPPFVGIIRNAADNALHDAGHAVQNHLIKSQARVGHARAMYLKIPCIQKLYI